MSKLPAVDPRSGELSPLSPSPNPRMLFTDPPKRHAMDAHGSNTKTNLSRRNQPSSLSNFSRKQGSGGSLGRLFSSNKYERLDQQQGFGGSDTASPRTDTPEIVAAVLKSGDLERPWMRAVDVKVSPKKIYRFPVRIPPDTDGVHIFMDGDVTPGSESYSMTFSTTHGDGLFHFNPILTVEDPETEEPELFVGSYINKDWITEFTFPLPAGCREGEYFRMEVEVNDRCFRVLINDVLVTEYPHVEDYLALTNVQVAGSVHISAVGCCDHSTRRRMRRTLTETAEAIGASLAAPAPFNRIVRSHSDSSQAELMPGSRLSMEDIELDIENQIGQMKTIHEEVMADTWENKCAEWFTRIMEPIDHCFKDTLCHPRTRHDGCLGVCGCDIDTFDPCSGTTLNKAFWMCCMSIMLILLVLLLVYWNDLRAAGWSP
eukprot:GFYU01012852.1.p1 GENE.GFYU01012852.1~~GFYU01012852.1.p1  ORF type:complete len:430 (+),score=89.48 GFYU01012852.1:366-1655(+)